MRVRVAALAMCLGVLVPGVSFAERPATPVEIRDDTVKRITIIERIPIDAPVQFVSGNVYTVPDGRRLLVDYVSLNLDALILGGQPGQPVKANIGSLSPFHLFELGLMEGIDNTTRGAPQRFIGRAVPVSFGPGQSVLVRASPELSSVNLDFGFLDVVIAGRLVTER